VLAGACLWPGRAGEETSNPLVYSWFPKSLWQYSLGHTNRKMFLTKECILQDNISCYIWLYLNDNLPVSGGSEDIHFSSELLLSGLEALLSYQEGPLNTSHTLHEYHREYCGTLAPPANQQVGRQLVAVQSTHLVCWEVKVYSHS